MIGSASDLLFGVCRGLSDRFGLDVTLVRLAFVVTALASGAGLVIYLALWIGLPASLGGRSHGLAEGASQAWGRLRERLSLRGKARVGGVDRRLIGLGLVTLGAMVLLASLGLFGWLTTVRGLALAAVVGGAALLVRLA